MMFSWLDQAIVLPLETMEIMWGRQSWALFDTHQYRKMWSYYCLISYYVVLIIKEVCHFITFIKLKWMTNQLSYKGYKICKNYIKDKQVSIIFFFHDYHLRILLYSEYAHPSCQRKEDIFQLEKSKF